MSRACFLLAWVVFAGCASDDGDAVDAATGADAAAVDGAMPSVTLFPENGRFDYQLGGGYPPPSGFVTVVRDRTDSIAPGLYNICYVNGFQAQPGEEDAWEQDLILRDDAGAPVIDEDWDEALLDISTEDKRERVARVVNGFIDGCVSKGFDAIEIDNLDSYARSGGRLTQDDAVALMAALSAHAHDAGVAIAQKNSTELLARTGEMGTDFAVAEECSRYDECGDYVEAYGRYVLMIEYRDGDFESGCSGYGATHPIVRRDLDLVTPDSGDYVLDDC